MTDYVKDLTLTDDQLHVLLDCVSGQRRRGWSGGYDSDPAEDPKASEAGWFSVLDAAEQVLTDALGRSTR